MVIGFWSGFMLIFISIIMTAGSDCHRMGDYCRAGIITDILPNDTFQFAEILKSENYYVFCRNDRTYKHKYEESVF